VTPTPQVEWLSAESDSKDALWARLHMGAPQRQRWSLEPATPKAADKATADREAVS
jgi:hypothetical protein